VIAQQSRAAPPQGVPRQRDWAEFLETFGATHAVTLVLNVTMSVDQVQRLVDLLHYYIDRELIGPRFTRAANADRRTSYVGLIEHLDTNTHVHLLWLVPEFWGDEHRDFEVHLPRLWKRIVRSGSCVVEPIYDEAGWASYITKELRDPRLQGSPHLIFSRNLR
jgi:hypothetical protein